ncbi:hypothetical protein MELLADRAFT_91370 [Melampsora larici-populina 98AG31]|uniref:Uncharacterized protein n=1 Tax=Melampsora larici-populina (strain 98AG31 / pathotype 3-4-7) TaxID=747676 RepID=F4RYT5_MELLP|nr:hypothetical protein MELLADRAFT_91370 [Melampsora larici-populina 98AG31]
MDLLESDWDYFWATGGGLGRNLIVTSLAGVLYRFPSGKHLTVNYELVRTRGI